ncbi:MAG: hypothetical protein ITG01_14565 [Comamonas sp.]|nr:hypothetical protein [Comamonas sp.]
MAEVPDPQGCESGSGEDVTEPCFAAAKVCSGFVTKNYADCNDQPISDGAGRIAASNPKLRMKKASRNRLAFYEQGAKQPRLLNINKKCL